MLPSVQGAIPRLLLPSFPAGLLFSESLALSLPSRSWVPEKMLEKSMDFFIRRHSLFLCLGSCVLHRHPADKTNNAITGKD
jgi:hypothetical protein